MGKKSKASAAAGKAATTRANVAAGKAIVEESSSKKTGDWRKSTFSQADADELVAKGLLAGMQYGIPGDEEIPNPSAGWRVIFLSFLLRGLSLPAHEFLRGLLFVYGVQLFQLTPNAILQLAVFITFCEGYLGIHPHWGLWKHFYFVRSSSKGAMYSVGSVSFSIKGNSGFIENSGQDSVQGWREKWFYVKDMPLGDQEYNLEPFVNNKPEALDTWQNKLTRSEKAEVKKLLPRVLEAVGVLESQYGFTRLVSVFMGRRLQPLQSRPTAMWEYTGDVDESRYDREDLENVGDQNGVEVAVRGVIKGSKTRKLPSECPVDPFSASLSLPEGHVCIKYFPQLPEDPVSSDTEDDEENEDLFELPPAADEDEEQRDSDDDSSGSSPRALEHGSKASHDANIQKPIPPTRDPAESSSGIPSSSKPAPMAPPQSAPSASTMARPKLNDLGLPVGSSDSGSSDGETLSKKVEAKKVEATVSSKEKTADPVIEPLNPKKRPAEVSKDKQAKKLKEGEASIPQPEIPVPPTSGGSHLELHQDPVASSLFAAAQSYVRIKTERDQLQESLSRSESKMRNMEEALEKAQDEAKKAKDELKKLKKTLETYKKEATEAFDKAKEHTRKVEDGFRGLVNKISEVGCISLGPLDAVEKTSELFLRAKVALERWHSNVFLEAELPKTFGELLDKYAAPADPLMQYRATKLKEGAESALLMVLAHGVEESTLEKIAASFPKNDEGQEVDVKPFVKPSRRFARKINEYLTAHKKKLTSESTSSAKPAEDVSGTSKTT